MTRSLLVAVFLFASATADVRAEPEDVSKCAIISGKASYGALGYDHFVEVDNRCTKPVVCEVWTDVDPDPHHPLEVQPGHKVSARTRVGSPAREFAAKGKCELK